MGEKASLPEGAAMRVFTAEEEAGKKEGQGRIRKDKEE